MNKIKRLIKKIINGVKKMFGIKIGDKQFKDFDDPKKHNYGLMGGGKELDINKLKIIDLPETFRNVNIKCILPPYNGGKSDPNKAIVNMSDETFIKTNNRLRVVAHTDWHSKDFWVNIQGDVIRVANTNLKKSDYGIEVFGKQITTKDTVMQYSKTLAFNNTAFRVDHNDFVNAKWLMQNLLKIISDINQDFAFDLQVKDGTLFISFDGSYFWDNNFTFNITAYKYV